MVSNIQTGNRETPLLKYTFILSNLYVTVWFMKKLLGILPVLAAFMLPNYAFASQFEGPLEVKNQFPIFLPINQPYLEQAATENSFSVSLSHSSVFVIEDAAEWNVHMDMELTELNFRFRRDIPGFFEIGVDLPILRATAGFLDQPLATYHRTFGFADYGRSTRPYNSFLYSVERNGAPVVIGQNNRIGFGDTRLTVKRAITTDDPRISVAADVELPTGDAKIGYGSGSVDTGLSLLLDKNLGSSSKLYTNIGAVFPGDLKAYQTIKLDNFYYVGCGLEYLLWPRLSLIAQLVAQTSPYPHTGISQIDNTGMILVMGGRYYGAEGSIEFSLTEDPNTSGAPDFILNVSYKIKY